MSEQGVFGLQVPPGGVLIPVNLDFPATIHISMAALDPTAEPEADDEGKVPATGRSTLRLVRRPIKFLDEDDEDDDEDESDIDDEYLQNLLAGSDSDDDDEPNGGPSDPSKARRKEDLRALLAAAAEEDDDEDDEDEEMADAAAVLKSAAKKNGKADKVKGKGKEPATEEDDEDDEDEDDEDDDDLVLEDFVVCTLDTEKNYQQTLELNIEPTEEVFFCVSGSHTVHLTGNYFIDDEEDSDEDDSDDDDYDLPPDMDLEELDSDEADELDELDELKEMGNRIEEIDSDEEVPKLTSAKKAKGKKRPAEDAEPGLDDLIAKSATSVDETKMSKKQAKKLKNNLGDAVAAQEDKDKKRVQFAKTLEQGPTGSTAKEAAVKQAPKDAGKGKLGVKVVQGVTIDDRKLGSGRVVKNGDRVGMRYIGKLENGKVFDSNKKGAPFSFRVGKGEVIRGWDIGIAGMSIGGERRLTIPASLAYGSKKLDGIPANSTLIFDVKLLEIK
ncbi:MAG: peptidylprolyl isomerase fpr3 [Sporothrix epigloea]